MMWSLFGSKKEPHELINELGSEDLKIRKAAYKDLLNFEEVDCDDLLLDALNSKDTEKDKKLALISLLGHRSTEEAIPTFNKLLKDKDLDLSKAVADALFEIGNKEAIDILVKLLGSDEESLRNQASHNLSKLSTNEAMGALLRSVPTDKNSALYFEIVSLMEELDLFDELKKNFSQPDPMIKKFYFDTIIKFDRPDFIALYIDYYKSASTEQKEIIIEKLKEFDIKELLEAFKEYSSQKGTDNILGLIDRILIPKYKDDYQQLLSFIISMKDVKYKLKVLPALFKHLDPFCYDITFEMLKESNFDLRDLATTALIDLVEKTYKRTKDYKENNKQTIDAFFAKWKKQIVSLMQQRDELNDDYYKCIRRLFFAYCNINHDMLQPIALELASKNFYETYYLLREWSFQDKFNLYAWMLKTEPSFGSIVLSSLNARADETLWRIAIKLSTAFEEDEDSVIYIKNLIGRHINVSFERFLKDDDPGVRAATIEICAVLKHAGYIDLLKSNTKDPYPVVRKAALKSLLNDHLVNSDSFLLGCLDDPDESIVLYLLKRLKTRLGAQSLSPYLVRFLNSPVVKLRDYAKLEIAEITKERYKVNYNNMTPEMRKLAAQAIQKIDTSFTDEIIKDLSHFDPQTRLKAALLLESIQGDEKAQNALLAAMKDPSKKVRAAIVKTLGIIGEKKIIQHLISFFNDPDLRVRANTVEAISGLGDLAVVQILFPYLEDSNNRIRANAIVGICKIGKYNVSTVLHNMLLDPDENMKASALWAIGEIGEPAYLGFTYQFLNDKSELLRYNAIKTISRINPSLLAPYMPLLRKDNSPKIRNIVKELSFKLI